MMAGNSARRLGEMKVVLMDDLWAVWMVVRKDLKMDILLVAM